MQIYPIDEVSLHLFVKIDVPDPKTFIAPENHFLSPRTHQALLYFFSFLSFLFFRDGNEGGTKSSAQPFELLRSIASKGINIAK